MIVDVVVVVIIITIIIRTTTRKESWPSVEISSTLLDSWLLPTSLIPTSLSPFSLHLCTCPAVFLLLLFLQVAYTSLLGIQIYSILVTWPTQRSLAVITIQSFFKRWSLLLNLHLHWSLPFVGPRILRGILLSNTSTIFSSLRDNNCYSAQYSILGRTKVL